MTARWERAVLMMGDGPFAAKRQDYIKKEY